ncbi:oxygenase MpaB family protein [Sphingomonas sp. M6A6_1c]
MSMMQDMLKPPAGLDFDFTTPPGEPALVPADGVTWRVFANPVTMFIGGVAAVLLEMAEPSVRSGVWDHSSFRTDPGTRLRRTGFTAMITVYGARSRATEVIAHVVGIHDRVRGTTPDGTPYRANDPRLLDWVQATATFGFTQAYHRFARPLTPVEQDAAFAEGQVAARLYGATGAPRSRAKWDRLLAETAPRLEPSEILGEFLAIMNGAAILPRWARGLQRLLVRAAVDMVPDPVRSLPQLRGEGLRFGESLVVTALARAAMLAVRADSPVAQSRRRVGEG